MQDSNEDAAPRVAIVTGGYGAIGKAIARRLAETPGFEVVLVGRDAAKTERAAAAIAKATGNARVRAEAVDLSRKAAIEAFAVRWSGPLGVLVNNAATSPRRRRETPEGIEVQFAANVLGYFWMIQAFTPMLRESASARVVNVASYWAGDLELDDLEFKRRAYSNNTAYRQSKQAVRMLTAAFAERLRGESIAVNACHPGDVNSKLSNDLGFGGHESPDQGADTPFWLATDAAGQRHTGCYFEHRRETPCRFGADQAAVEALYDRCAAY